MFRLGMIEDGQRNGRNKNRQNDKKKRRRENRWNIKQEWNIRTKKLFTASQLTHLHKLIYMNASNWFICLNKVTAIKYLLTVSLSEWIPFSSFSLCSCSVVVVWSRFICRCSLVFLVNFLFSFSIRVSSSHLACLYIFCAYLSEEQSCLKRGYGHS